MTTSRYPSRFVGLEAARRAFGDRVDRVGRHLLATDVPADAVIASIAERPGEGWRTIERALAGEAVAGGPIKELVERAADVPAWVDWPTCDRGGELLLRAGPLGGVVLGTRSLVLGYATPGGNKPLVFSGRLTEQAGRRLNETARFVQAVCRAGGMRPFADGWKITLKVRLIHAQVRRMILASARWKEGDWGHPLNQHDLAGTTLLFSLSIVDGLRKLGMRIDPEEAASYIHLWRWVGRTIGVDADILPASELEAVRLAEVIEATTGDPDDDSRALTRALFDAAMAAARTAEQRREARRRTTFGQVICRELLGDELADKLDVPRTNIRYAMPMMKGLVAGAGRLARALPFGDRHAVQLGSRYWDRVVEVGLQGADYEFPLPRSLGNRAA